MKPVAYQPDRLFDGENFIEKPVVVVQAGQVAGHGPAASIIPLPGLTMAPALVDLQVYGGQGSLFSTDPSPEAIRKTYEQHRRGGTLHFYVTYHTGPPEGMLRAIAACNAYRQQGGRGLLGLHLEGPYFSPEKRGAHLERHIRPATRAELQTLLAAADGLPLLLTLAPERCPPEVLAWLLQSPIRLSAGHTSATYAQATAAFNAGLGLATHLYNAMTPLGSREPGVVGAVFDHPGVQASVICDGIHADFAAVRIAKKIMGPRLFYITDAVTEDLRGEYRFLFNPKTGRFEDGNGTLSGSALTLWQAVQHGIGQVGIEPGESLRMASAYPADAVGEGHRLGWLLPGYAADAVLYDAAGNLRGLLVGGTLEMF